MLYHSLFWCWTVFCWNTLWNLVLDSICRSLDWTLKLELKDPERGWHLIQDLTRIQSGNGEHLISLKYNAVCTMEEEEGDCYNHINEQIKLCCFQFQIWSCPRHTGNWSTLQNCVYWGTQRNDLAVGLFCAEPLRSLEMREECPNSISKCLLIVLG